MQIILYNTTNDMLDIFALLLSEEINCLHISLIPAAGEKSTVSLLSETQVIFLWRQMIALLILLFTS